MSNFGKKFRISGGLGVLSSWGAVHSITGIQARTVTIANAASSNTDTIATVDMNSTTLDFLGNSANGAGAEHNCFARLILTNATTVTATRGSTTGTLICAYRITQNSRGIYSRIQRGTITIANGAASGTATLTNSVGLTRVEVVTTGFSIAPGGAVATDDVSATVVLTNETTLTATRIGTAANLIIGYEVRERY